MTVSDAVENSKSIAAADLTIITGMTLSDGTLPSLLEIAKTSNTSTMIWAVTGRNLGQYYTPGVDCVISDPSPFFQLSWARQRTHMAERNRRIGTYPKVLILQKRRLLKMVRRPSPNPASFGLGQWSTLASARRRRRAATGRQTACYLTLTGTPVSVC